MINISFIKLELEILKKVGKQLNSLINNMQKNQVIIDGINKIFIEEYNDNNCEEVIKSNLKKVLKTIEFVNTTCIVPNIEDVINATIDLTIQEKGYYQDSETSEAIKYKTDKILENLFSFSSELYEDYKKNIIDNNVLNVIPQLLLEISENQGFKKYVKTIPDKMISLNQKRKPGVKNITIDFFDYKEEEFEKELIKRIKDEQYLIISGPSIEEALFYSAFVLENNNIKNVYIVESVENWNLIQAIRGTNYYKNIVFIVMFDEEVDPIPNSTTIILADNNSCQTQAEGLIRFEKRRKHISVEKLKIVLDVPDSIPSSGRYTHNDIYIEINNCYNEYSVYKNLIFNSLSQVRYSNLTKDQALLALVGSFSKNVNSKDFKMVTKYFPTLSNTFNEKLPFKTITLGNKFTVLDRDKILKDIIEQNILGVDEFYNYILFAVKTYYLYISKRENEKICFTSDQTISKNMYDAISTTCTLLLKNKCSIQVNREIYKGVIENYSDDKLKTKVKIQLFSELLKYDIEYLIEELNDLLSIDKLSVLTDNIPGYFLYYRTYGDDLLPILERLLYSEEYSIEIPEIIQKAISMISNESIKEKYIKVLKVYFSYIGNDYPPNDMDKLRFLEKKSPVVQSILDYIVNTDYQLGSIYVNEIKEEFGYFQCKRQRFTVERNNYIFAIQKLYLNSANDIILEKVIDRFAVYHLSHENNNLLIYLGKNRFSDAVLIRSILTLRRMLCLEWGSNRKNDLLLANGFKLLDILEKKLSDIELKSCYIFQSNYDENLLLKRDLLSGQTLEESTEIIDQMRKGLLKKDKLLAKKLVKLFMQNNTEYFDDIDYVIEVMVYANISFEEAVEIFELGNSCHRKSPDLFANHLKFGLSQLEVYNYVVNNTSIDSDKGYYLQRVNFSIENIKKLDKSCCDINIILKYFNVYDIKEEDILEYYRIFKNNNTLDKCMEILYDRLSQYNIFNKLNIISEMIDLFSSNEIAVLGLTEYKTKQLYNQCIKYYQRYNSIENRDKLRLLTLILIRIIDNYDFWARQLFEDREYLFHVMKIVYNEEFEVELDELQKKDFHIYHFALLKVDMNCIELVDFSSWVNGLINEFSGSPIQYAVISFISSLCGKYFDFNKEIVQLLDLNVVRNKDFQRKFTIAYSNTMGVLTYDINSVPSKCISRRNMLQELKCAFATSNMKSHEKLVDQLIDDINLRIKEFESIGRN